MMRALSGWERIGVVLSSLWVLGVLLYVFYEYRELSVKYAHNLAMPTPPQGFVINPVATPYFFRWKVIDPRGGAPFYIQGFELHAAHFLRAIVAPIFSLWVVGFVIGWVRQGFWLQSQ